MVFTASARLTKVRKGFPNHHKPPLRLPILVLPKGLLRPEGTTTSAHYPDCLRNTNPSYTSREPDVFFFIPPGIFAEGPRVNIHAGKDSYQTLGPGFIPKKGASDEGIFSDGPRRNKYAGKDSQTSLGPDWLPKAELVDEGIFKEGPRRNVWAGEDTRSSITMQDGVMMGDDKHTQREAFASEYSELHAHKDTEDHFDPGMVPQVQWKGGGGAQAAYDRRKELANYYDESAKAVANEQYATHGMQKLNFHRVDANDEVAAGLPGDRFHREGNALVRTKRTL